MTSLPTIDWPGFLSAHDPIWDRLPRRWEEAPFVGNGLVGALLFVRNNRLILSIGRSDVGKLDFPGQFKRGNRMVIGEVQAVFNEDLFFSGADLRMDLWNAEITGTLSSNLGVLALRCWAPSGGKSLIIELNGPEEICWQWQGHFAQEGTLNAAEDRTQFLVEDAQHCPETETRSGGHAVVWDHTVRTACCICSIGANALNRKQWQSEGDTDPEMDQAAEAQADYDHLQSQDLTKTRQEHQAWWHSYFQRSFLSMGDHELESFYWIQRYLFASATRPDRPLLDNHGPWTTEECYGFSTWDYNVQVVYAYPLTSNLLDFGQPLWNFFQKNFNPDTTWHEAGEEHRAGMRQQIFLRYLMPDRDTWDHGRLPCDGPGKFLWGLHNCYLHWRHSDDEQMLAPLTHCLCAGIHAMLAGMEQDGDGIWHIPRGGSWEAWKGRDPTGLIAILRWALQRVLELKALDPSLQVDRDRYQQVLRHIPAYPLGENGYLLGENKAAVPHRHWTHLLMAYPLDCMTPEDGVDPTVLRRSIEQWAKLSAGNEEQDPKAFAPIAASALFAMLQAHSEDELGPYITRYIDSYLHRATDRGPLVWPATLYREYGPVREASLFAASVVDACCLQSRHDGVHIFPAAPEQLTTACFDRFHAFGGLLVSAQREQGQVSWIRLRAQRELHTRIFCRQADWHAATMSPSHPAACTWSVQDNSLSLSLQAGAVLDMSWGHSDLAVEPVAHHGATNSFGMNARFYRSRPHFDPKNGDYLPDTPCW